MTDRPTLVFAHRGGRKWAPENTLSAFGKTIELGADGIELDIQRCASGELVVFHDSNLSRTTNGAGRIVDCTLSELKRLSAGIWFGLEFADERIPTLEQVLSQVDGQLILNIEIKNLPERYPGIEDDLAEHLGRYQHPEKVVISSFDHRVIASMSKKYPDYTYAVLMSAIPDDIAAYAASLNAQYWNPEHEFLEPESVQQAKSAGMKILPWTANSDRQWSRLLFLGVDGIITDDPEGLVAFLDAVRSVSQ